MLSDAYLAIGVRRRPAVLGKTISLNTHAFQIVGVAQAGFAGLEVGRGTQVFAPICAEPVFRGPNTLPRSTQRLVAHADGAHAP